MKIPALISRIVFLSSAVFFISCNQGANKSDVEKLKEETIAVHDEIMPQISSFDRQGIRIDSILISLDSLHHANPELDTAQIRTELTELKSKLSGATDAMMTWMVEFEANPEDKDQSETIAYFEQELVKMKEMRQRFQDVAEESANKMARFQQ